LVTAFLAANGAAEAAILEDQKNLSWRSNRDLTSEQFSQKFKDYRDRGFLMIDIDAYPSGTATRYSMVWRKNTDGRGWAEHRDMNSERYNQRWTEYKNRGFRPLDVETYEVGANRRWAGIWVENKENLAWKSNRNLTGERYGELFQERREAGFRLIDVEVYRTANGLRYAGIWVKNADNRPWAQLRNMTRAKYQQEVNQRSRNGFRVVDFEAYNTGSGMRYAAIWEKKPGYAWQTRTNRTKTQFANLWREYRDQGYRLVDFERYQTPSGALYAGIWAENDARYRYAKKGAIDSAISTYQSTNNIPGVSVAVIRNGNVIYRRGFGDADKAAGKKAHGGTIYGLASVSKAVGGALAAKLEDEGRLRGGRSVNLDLDNTTRSYLTNINMGGGSTGTMPSQHTHTVAQLTAHLGCVAHYPSRTNPGISNTTTHRSTARAASAALWNTGLVTDRDVKMPGNQSCSIGANRSYSTHAWTFVGAVLEQVSGGRSIARLVDEEIGQQYNLGTLRTMYRTSTLPANDDRSKLYDLDNSGNIRERGYQNNSWKVLGGGIEASAVDLARFGWKVLNGEIVDDTARDCRMWTQLDSNSNNGIGWELDMNAGRRIADHGGDARGMDSYIRIYRDEGLVIAILGNRDIDPNRREPLADSIATTVLGSTVTPAPSVTCP
jgi:CubicO group peptidase (beta-lactamase class C family)